MVTICARNSDLAITRSDNHVSWPDFTLRKELPIYSCRNKILHLLRTHQVIIVSGEAGCGKTTQLPLMCLEAGRGRYGKIGITQPRRIAATSIARRVALDCESSVGAFVGCETRFSKRESRQTVVKFMTDGILLTELRRDRLLKHYDTLIIDEAHERTLNIDFILGYLRKILQRRRNLKVIISSATINTRLFSQAFHNAPIVEAGGRMYHVELHYAPLTGELAEKERGYIQAAVESVEDVCSMSSSGDLLLFMPTERDIIETVRKLSGRRFENTVVLPLFARLSQGRQAGIFEQSQKRKIVVSTNVAETSLTVPGVKYVIDTGLARLKRFSPHARVTRLPVESISRASADQRMGRCGRVQNGVCIRLYSEEDYGDRDAFTPPEIQRSNLSDVILRMAEAQLGDIAHFPFLEPPPDKAVKDGFAHLIELGALTPDRKLASTGRNMAKFPLDPHISRMLVASHHENVTAEVAILAAGLSAMEPRERPREKQDEADIAHRRLCDNRSDFLSYLTLWNAYHEAKKELKSQSRIRGFCRKNFLSYNRMQEWVDIYRQISHLHHPERSSAVLSEEERNNAIHRSVLTGLVSNVALQKQGNTYRSARGREVMLFPGSVLYHCGPRWIACQEIVETSQLFARTVGPIDPSWVIEFARPLCRFQRLHPFFDAETGFVRAYETVTIFGLPLIEHRLMHLGGVDRKRARDIFIREALTEEKMEKCLPFYLHNKKVRAEISGAEAKLRRRDIMIDDAVIAQWYDERLPDIVSEKELQRFCHHPDNDASLRFDPQTLLARSVPDDVAKYPDVVKIGGTTFNVSYKFDPGSRDDGATVQISSHERRYLDETVSDWVIPELYRERIYHHVKSLPKRIRKRFVPLPQTAENLASVIEQYRTPGTSFEKALAQALHKKYGQVIPSSAFDKEKLPAHVKVHFSSQLQQIEQQVVSHPTSDKKWESEFKKWGKRKLMCWDFGDISDKVAIVQDTEGHSVFGYPALCSMGDRVDLIATTSIEKRNAIHLQGVRKLFESVASKELAWLTKDVRFSHSLKVLAAPWGETKKMERQLFAMIKSSALPKVLTKVTTPQKFAGLEERGRQFIVRAGQEALELYRQTLEMHGQLSQSIRKHAGALRNSASKEIARELELMLSNYMRELHEGRLHYPKFRNYPRYFKAFRFRIERAFSDPAKYRQRRAIELKYSDKCDRLKSIETPPEGILVDIDEFDLMVEEFRVSLFAQQEVRTVFPISEKRLDKKWGKIKDVLVIEGFEV
ncbi:MAG: ATP-dependent RNA helicase HrpA [Chitinivibrionales bacterium]|nr:ATP-dependent RNA helicase HrpA [Chitinivibrionales bacterium]